MAKKKDYNFYDAMGDFFKTISGTKGKGTLRAQPKQKVPKTVHNTTLGYAPRSTSKARPNFSQTTKTKPKAKPKPKPKDPTRGIPAPDWMLKDPKPKPSGGGTSQGSGGVRAAPSFGGGSVGSGTGGGLGSLGDLIKVAVGLTGGAPKYDPNDGIDFSALRKAATSDSARTRSQLGALYNALSSDFNQQVGGVKGIFDTGIANSQALQSTAQNNINAAYNAMNAYEQGAAQRAGISDADVVSLAHGSNPGADQAAALQALTNYSNNDQQLLNANSTAAQNYMKGLASAAQFTGINRQADVTQALSDKLATIDAQQQQAQAKAESDYANATSAWLDSVVGAVSKFGDYNLGEGKLSLDQLKTQLQNKINTGKLKVAQQNANTSQSAAEATAKHQTAQDALGRVKATQSQSLSPSDIARMITSLTGSGVNSGLSAAEAVALAKATANGLNG